jgi:hypothetical protein
MDSTWRDRPAYNPYPQGHSGLLGDDEYDYDAPLDAPQHVPWPRPEKKEEMVVPVEEYMPLGISKEAIQMAIKDSDLIELS